MDNSVDYVTLFSELSIREFWTNYNLITRILYKYDWWFWLLLIIFILGLILILKILITGKPK